jgi:hypothetical protein
MSNEVEELIKKGEGQNTEFKDSLSLKKEIGETVSAFSNTRGGTILIGIFDFGGVKGVEVGKRALEELANYLKINTDPHIYCRVLILFRLLFIRHFLFINLPPFHIIPLCKRISSIKPPPMSSVLLKPPLDLTVRLRIIPLR